MTGKRKTREERLTEIRIVAGNVFACKGYHHTTMENIIEMTELSKGGFYHYYGNKKEILIDLMKDGNTQYMLKNPFMLKLNHSCNDEEKVEIILDAFLDKALVVNEGKRVYTMFAYEAMYDSEIWDIFLDLEKEFIEFLFNKLGLDKKIAMEDMLLISRLVNALLFSQNISRNPKLLIEKRKELKEMLRPLLNKLIYTK